MIRKVLLLLGSVLFSFYVFSQSQPNPKKVFEEMKLIQPEKFITQQNAELVLENQSLNSQVENLEMKNQSNQDLINRLEMELEYFKIRAQIESETLPFTHSSKLYYYQNTYESTDIIKLNFYYNGPCYSCKSLFDSSSENFPKLFPNTLSKIRLGKLILNDTAIQIEVFLQVKKVKFLLPAIQNPKEISKKKELTNQYLKFFNELNATGNFKFDVMGLYSELEKEASIKGNIDKLLKFQQQYSIYLKKIYDKNK